MRLIRLAAVGAGILLALTGCTNKPHADKPKAVPARSASPFPSPSVVPRTAPSLIGYTSPLVRVIASAVPWEGLVVHSRVKVDLTIINDADQTYALRLYFVLPNGVTWKLYGTPRGAEVEQNCEPPHDPAPAHPCSPSGMDISVNLPPMATRHYGFEMELLEFRCPGQGDFSRFFGLGVSGPVARGPNGYDIAARYENDADDYRRAYGTPPPKYNCDVETTY